MSNHRLKFLIGRFAFIAAAVLIGTNDGKLCAQETSALEQRLQQADWDVLAREARARGDSQRGALVFYTSGAACAKCHVSESDRSPLGPNLATLSRDYPDQKISDRHVIESLLDPSRSIRHGYETIRVLTDDGRVVSGMLVRQTDTEIVLRDALNLDQEITIDAEVVEDRSVSDKSMMPSGLVSTFTTVRDFLDLARYVMEIIESGPTRADQLMPSPVQMVVRDDTSDLNHAGIIRNLNDRDYKKGEAIYQGYCAGCHGVDGNTPSLATARAFGTQKLKFGADPYRMFMTLSLGNGLMAATTHLSPKERYQAVHYIRERFMKDSNPDYMKTNAKYLASLPKGTQKGDFKSSGDRDFGPALASQLGRDVTSALTVKLGNMTIAYNLHTLDQVGVWQGGFLNLDETQHQRGRGEGYPEPIGTMLPGLAGWQWAHDGTFDYSQDGLLPRGPLPNKWIDYRGHYLHDQQLVLSYRVDGRDILELPSGVPNESAVIHTLQIAAGEELMLATAQGNVTSELQPVQGVITANEANSSLDGINVRGAATDSIAFCGQREQDQIGQFTASRVIGDTQGMTWSIDQDHRLVLRIPADNNARVVDVICMTGNGIESLDQIAAMKRSVDDPSKLVEGGSLRWPKVQETMGLLGFEQGAYAVDTLTVPESTPWNTWFRTSAIDFFPDGRLVVATVGGDVWIVSGIDDDLMNLRWKRFAGGMYEPFGLKVVDGMIYVTCKDRLTRLHDINEDGEADFYESFSADTDVSTFFHAFNFDLQTDSQGNFYYAKCGQYTDHALPGAIVKVSPDGTQRSIVCTGLRTPNGIGMLADDRVTVSDNQGNWMPASKVSLVKQDGFYGYVQTHAGGAWAPDGGHIDHKKVTPPKTFDPPMIWMPQEVDNSSGGQIWVDDERWGPLSGRLLHTSFGKGWLFYTMIQEVEGTPQAAIVRMPHDFSTGIMRGRVNPVDGQVYVVGLNGWNDNGRLGLRDNGIERVRYTGKTMRIITDCQVEADALRLTFNFPLDKSSAEDLQSYSGEQWDYRWTAAYGSPNFHPETGEEGKQTLRFSQATLSDDGHTVRLEFPELRPVNQLHLKLNVMSSNEEAFSDEVYWTINKIPRMKIPGNEISGQTIE